MSPIQLSSLTAFSLLSPPILSPLLLGPKISRLASGLNTLASLPKQPKTISPCHSSSCSSTAAGHQTIITHKSRGLSSPLRIYCIGHTSHFNPLMCKSGPLTCCTLGRFEKSFSLSSRKSCLIKIKQTKGLEVRVHFLLETDTSGDLSGG